MPTYDYKCTKCKSVQEEIHSIKIDPEIKCKKCGNKMLREISSNVGLVFRGTGFYVNDYKYPEERTSSARQIRKDVLSGSAKAIEDIGGPSAFVKEPKHKSKKCKPVKRRSQ